LGLDHGQDFRLAKDRLLGRALVRRLKPRHLWGAFPCTPFCAWIRLAILRNCDMTFRLKEGGSTSTSSWNCVASKHLMAGRHSRESTHLLGLEGTDSGRSACGPSVVEGAS
jgi:hypothetical protein